MDAANDQPILKLVPECGKCQWFNPHESHKGQAGECRADPPQALVIPSKSIGLNGQPNHFEIQAAFPTVPAKLWCSRFYPKQATIASPLIEQPG